MKKYFLQGDGRSGRPHYPFWKPWGLGGCLGRLLGFVILLVLFMLLLLLCSTLFKCCCNDDDKDASSSDDSGSGYYNPQPAPTNPGTSNPGIEFPTPVPGYDDPVPFGPDPGYVPQPVDDAPQPFIHDPNDIIDNPDGPGQIDRRHLYVIIDQSKSQANPALDRFVEEFRSLYPTYGIYPESQLDIDVAVIEVPEAKREELRTKLPGQITDVDFIIDNIQVLQGMKTPGDPIARDAKVSWHLPAVKAPEAWDITMGNPSVKVAVIDNYFDLGHPDLKGIKIEKALSMEHGNDNVYPPTPRDNHGTHVLGLMAAQANGMGTVGIAPDCTYIPISLGRAGNAYTIICAIMYAVKNGATVINASLGFLDRVNIPIDEQVRISQEVRLREQRAWDYVADLLENNYCTMVWAGGNENLLEIIDWSKRKPSVIRAAAVDRNLNKASFSNFGNVDATLNGRPVKVRSAQISAPGVDVMSSVPGNYATMSGTSMAAPIVAGGVALIKSVNPTLTNSEIINLLQTTGKKLANDSIGPLMQIRPALDAVRNSMTEWEEFKKNPSAKGGIWKEVGQQRYGNRSRKNDDSCWYAHDYYIFDSRQSGIIETHVIGRNAVFNARFNVTWNGDEAILDIIPPYVGPDENSISISTRKLRIFKSTDGKVGIQQLEPNRTSLGTLRRLVKDDRVNTNKRKI